LHCPEFRLLEWYRKDEPWQALLGDCEQLILGCAHACGCNLQFTYAGQCINISPPYLRMSVEEAFQTYAGFSILDALERPLLSIQLQQLGLSYEANDSWEDLFHRVFLNIVEPQVALLKQPLFLTHFPRPLAALARLHASDRRVSERFELYIAGVELANGFGELTDSHEQRQRFVAENQLREDLQKTVYPMDEKFLASLAEIREASGIALGFERLVMILTQSASIDEISFIPWQDC